MMDEKLQMLSSKLSAMAQECSRVSDAETQALLLDAVEMCEQHAAAKRLLPKLQEELRTRTRERDEAHTALTRISAIRDSIIGCQKFNWSEHCYPLVAALDEAGFKGATYPEARENCGTLIERCNAAEAELASAKSAAEEDDRLWAVLVGIAMKKLGLREPGESDFDLLQRAMRSTEKTRPPRCLSCGYCPD